MKKVIIILILGLNLILLKSCAKPKVLNITLPGDNELNCEKLEDALADAQEFRKKAISVTGNTAGNQMRALLFWPALMATYVNAHEAIMAASERSVHLINIMKKKNCKNLDELLVEVQSTHRIQTLKDLSEAYKNLNDLYKSGALTEKEFMTQKRKVLGQ